MRDAVKDLLEAVQAEIESAVSQRDFPARVVYDDTEKAHFAFGDGDETACIARWLKKFKHLDETARSARSTFSGGMSAALGRPARGAAVAKVTVFYGHSGIESNTMK